jgi:hypothetical protein
MCSSKLPWQRERREKLGEQGHNVYLKVTILRSPVSLFVKKSPVPAKLRENKQTGFWQSLTGESKAGTDPLRLSQDLDNRPDPAGILKRTAIGFDLSENERIERASLLGADLDNHLILITSSFDRNHFCGKRGHLGATLHTASSLEFRSLFSLPESD